MSGFWKDFLAIFAGIMVLCAGVVFLIAQLTGCKTEACKAEAAAARPTAYVSQAAPVASDSRVTVERIGVVADSLAYGGSRGVYVIRDKQTGQEFIGVSGIGISETGSHQSGKTQKRDER